MGHKFFDSGLTQNELMKRAFRIKPLVSNLPRDIKLPDDLRKEYTKMHFMQPTDLELGSMDERAIMEKCPADMLTPVRTTTITLNACGDYFMPVISELLAAVPQDLLYSVSGFSVDRDEAQPHDRNGQQRALVTWYTGDLPENIQRQYIIYDGQAYSPDWRLMEKLDRIEVMKPVKIKGPGR